MRLRSVHIEGFGRLSDRRVDFDPRITLILGDNEAGKSTLLQAIGQVLMGKPSQKSLFADYRPWGGAPFAATVEFSHGEVIYRLTRRFAESGTRAVQLVRLHEDGSEIPVTHDAGEIRKLIAEAFGTSDDRIFYRVFCLANEDLHPLDQYAGLREQLERATSGAEVAVTSAVQRLDNRLAALRRGVGQPALPQNWGLLKRAMEARQEWESRLREIDRRQRRLEEAREEAEKLQTRIDEGATRRETITALLEQDRKRRDMLARKDELLASWNGLEVERGRFERLRNDRQRLQGRAGDLKIDPLQARARLVDLQREKVSPAWMGWLAPGIGVAASIILFVFSQYIFAGIPLALGLLIGIPILLRIRARESGIADLLAEMGAKSAEEAVERIDALEQVQREKEALDMALQAVGEVDDSSDRQRGLLLEIAKIEAALKEMPGASLSAEEGHRLSVEMRSLEGGLPEWRERERALMKEIAVLEQSERDSIDIEDGVAYWRCEESRAREEEAALLLARELLQAAGEQANDALGDPLAAQISPLFSAMTLGRYPQVFVSGAAKAFDLIATDAEGTGVIPDQLSRGARDQLLFSARLALGRVIAGEGGTPIFLLDDPFLHFDVERRAETIRALQEFSEGAQLIIASHDASLATAFPEAAVVEIGALVV